MRKVPRFSSKSAARFAMLVALTASSTGASPADVPAASSRPTIATLAIPGDPAFVAVARDVMDVQAIESPDVVAGDGLFDDATRVPSFAPDRVAALHARLVADEAALRALPWRTWDVDRQIDVRWVFANAETIDRVLTVERMYTHRPGAWLESLADDYIAVLTYAPQRRDVIDGITVGVPAMVDEMSHVCTPMQRDVTTANGLIQGILAMLATRPGPASSAAVASLSAYRKQIDAMPGLKPYEVVGADDYAWRLRRASMLDDTPASLLAHAERELTRVSAERSSIPKPVPPLFTQELVEDAKTLTQPSLLELYDRIEVENRDAIERAGFVTISAAVGPIHARVTPDAMVPLTGDGGSMNPPPPYLDSNVGYWNVEHFSDDASLPDREEDIADAVQFRDNSMGPYAAHEGVPGHHLQLSIARLNPDPIRNFWGDAAQVEGWALYAEQEFYDEGGLGKTDAAHLATVESWLFRIRRVVYDVNVETGAWDLQTAADWKGGTAPGKGKVDEDLLRTINWPAQLIGYFAGKEQILALKADYKAKLGAAYDERDFNDRLMALGNVPYVFARAKMLGEPVPGMEPEAP